jgi:hypothetical protein
MIEVGKLFYKYTQPLKEVAIPKKDQIYYNVEGHALRYRGNDEYEFLEGSPLRSGNLITELTPKQLSLFWKLVKNKSIYGINIVQ